jgi:hypothetical protein
MASGNGNLLGFVEMVMNLLLLEHAGISWLDEKALIT